MSNELEIQEANLAKMELSKKERMQFDVQYGPRRKDPNVALVLSIVGGTIGLDRFYIGDIGLGIAKILTLGGLFIWTIIDWFLIMGATRAKNSELMSQVRDHIIQGRT